jgi:ATP-binding cassette subfamily F protein 3
LRSFLAKFLFHGDDVYKHVSDLSGGEKGRLALAKLIYSRVNVLVLDEPTNHLDIPSREALEDALGAYEGTIITISHDRYFLDRIATQILSLDGEGHAEHYDGDYTEYHDWKAMRAKSGDSGPVERPVSRRIESDVSVHAEMIDERPQKSSPKTTRSKEERKPVKRIKVIKKKQAARPAEVVEAEIATAEKRLGQISEQMGLPEIAREAEQLIVLSGEYQQTEKQLGELYEEWEKLTADATNG